MKSRKSAFWAILLVVAGLLWLIQSQRQPAAKATYSELLAQVEAGKVKDAVITDSRNGANRVAYTLRDGTAAQTVLPKNYRDLLSAMQQKMVNIEITDPGPAWVRPLGNASPFLILLGFWFLMLNRLQSTRGAR